MKSECNRNAIALFSMCFFLQYFLRCHKLDERVFAFFYLLKHDQQTVRIALSTFICMDAWVHVKNKKFKTKIKRRYLLNTDRPKIETGKIRLIHYFSNFFRLSFSAHNFLILSGAFFSTHGFNACKSFF